MSHGLYISYTVYDYPATRVYANGMATNPAHSSLDTDSDTVEYLSLVSANPVSEEYVVPTVSQSSTSQLYDDVVISTVAANIAYAVSESMTTEENKAYNVHSERDDETHGYASIRENWLHVN